MLAKIRLSITHFFPLDHEEVTEPAYRDIFGGRETFSSLGRGGMGRRGVQGKKLNEPDSVGAGQWKKVVFWLVPGSWQGVWRDSGPLTRKRGRTRTMWKCPEALQGGLDHSLIPWASLRRALARKGNAKGGAR